jgi:hypothetical protein
MYRAIIFIYAIVMLIMLAILGSYALARLDTLIPQAVLADTQIFAGDIFGHLVPLLTSVLFGVFGALAKLAIEQDDHIEIMVQLASRKSQQSEDGSSAISTKTEKEIRRFQIYQSNTIAIGAIFGMVGYLVFSSKFILKLLYSDINFPSTAHPSFIGIAMCGFGFGYFAKEFAGLSKRAIEKHVEKILGKD